MEWIKFWFNSAVEAQNFPAWELYVFFTLCLLVSIIIRLARVEERINRNFELMMELVEEITDER